MYQHDSRKIRTNDTFICLPGGEPYIAEARQKGAAQVLRCTRLEMATLLHDVYDDPSQSVAVVGVTGTNGKTSVCHYVTDALRQVGKHVQCQGTLTHSLTTPESLETIQALAAHRDAGGTHFVMEVSSHAIAQDRVAGFCFTVKCLTNITQDHLDFHGSLAAYSQTKLGFMAEGAGAKVFSEDIQALETPQEWRARGTIECLNKNAALLVLLQLGISRSQAISALKQCAPPPGRLQFLAHSHPFDVCVDYAHTPAALAVVLADVATRAAKRGGRLIVCFGCGGGRDRLKRPKMGAIAAENADYIVLTQDNPRHEEPDRIIRDIVAGFPAGTPWQLELDRKRAIEGVIAMAKAGDAVVVAGKGHEKTQIIGKTTQPFCDVAIASEALKRWVPA